MRPLPRLLAVTDDRVCGADDFPIRAAAILSAGSSVAVVVRAPGAAEGTVRGYLERVRALARPTEAATIAHDDPTLGKLAGVQGVHLEAAGVDPGAARATFGRGWVGVSVRSLDEADRAVAGGADYLVAEGIFAAAPSTGGGLDWLRAVASRGAPVFAGGVVTREQVASLAAAGAWGLAPTGDLWTGADPAGATAEWLAALHPLG